MRHQPVNVGLGLACFLQYSACSAFQHAHRQLEDRLTRHLQQGQARDRTAAHMARHAQEIDVLAVGMQVAGQNARGVGGFQHHGARAIAKQHASTAVIEVKNAGEDFGTHHQRTTCRARLDKCVRHGQRIDKTAAHRLHVKGRAACRTELALQDAGSGREHHVGCGRGDDDQVNVLRRAVRRLQGVFGGFKRQVAAEHAFTGKVAGVDAAALDNPVV